MKLEAYSTPPPNSQVTVQVQKLDKIPELRAKEAKPRPQERGEAGKLKGLKQKGQ